MLSSCPRTENAYKICKCTFRSVGFWSCCVRSIVRVFSHSQRARHSHLPMGSTNTYHIFRRIQSSKILCSAKINRFDSCLAIKCRVCVCVCDLPDVPIWLRKTGLTALIHNYWMWCVWISILISWQPSYFSIFLLSFPLSRSIVHIFQTAWKHIYNIEMQFSR